jgi:hypothetical protein
MTNTTPKTNGHQHPRCGDCSACELDTDAQCLRCHGAPPHIRFPYDSMRIFPAVHADDWCREFTPRICPVVRARESTKRGRVE